VLLLLLASCASGPRPPADPDAQAREIRTFVDQLEQRCLDRNLTLGPVPRASQNMPTQLGEMYGGGLTHACTNWRVGRGGSQFDNGFFVYRNHQALIDEIKARFGVIYHVAVPIVGMCMNGREHLMLLRDGETMVRVYFGHYVEKTYCRRDSWGRWQAVGVRLSRPCRVGDATYMVCGPSGRVESVFSSLVNENQLISDDVVIARENVINLRHLSEAELEQLEQAMLTRDEDDAFLMRVAERVDYFDTFQDESRMGNTMLQGIIDASRAAEQERRERQNRLIAEGISETLGRASANFAADIARHQQFSEELAQTWRQQQAQQSLEALRERRQFDARQLPARVGGGEPSRPAEAQRLQRESPSVAGTSTSTAPRALERSVTAPRENKCWSVPEPPHQSCVGVTTQERDGHFFIRATNQCSRRIYTRVCGGRLSGPDFCAVRGVLPGSGWTHQVYASWQPTGTYQATWVGSEQSAEDWVCASQGGWSQ